MANTTNANTTNETQDRMKVCDVVAGPRVTESFVSSARSGESRKRTGDNWRMGRCEPTGEPLQRLIVLATLCGYRDGEETTPDPRLEIMCRFHLMIHGVRDIHSYGFDEGPWDAYTSLLRRLHDKFDPVEVIRLGMQVIEDNVTKGPENRHRALYIVANAIHVLARDVGDAYLYLDKGKEFAEEAATTQYPKRSTKVISITWQLLAAIKVERYKKEQSEDLDGAFDDHLKAIEIAADYAETCVDKSERESMEDLREMLAMEAAENVDRVGLDTNVNARQTGREYLERILEFVDDNPDSPAASYLINDPGYAKIREDDKKRGTIRNILPGIGSAIRNVAATLVILLVIGGALWIPSADAGPSPRLANEKHHLDSMVEMTKLEMVRVDSFESRVEMRLLLETPDFPTK